MRQLPEIEARVHLNEVLEYADKRLPSLMSFVKSTGRFFAVAPVGTSFEALLRFNQGGIAWSEPRQPAGGGVFVEKVQTMDRAAAEIILGAVAGFSEPVAWFHEPFVDLGDTTCEFVVIDGLRLGRVPLRGLGSEQLEEHLSNFSSAWHSLCFITDSGPDEVSDEVSSATQARSLEKLAAATRLIFVGAYDREGYVYFDSEEAIARSSSSVRLMKLIAPTF